MVPARRKNIFFAVLIIINFCINTCLMSDNMALRLRITNIPLIEILSGYFQGLRRFS